MQPVNERGRAKLIVTCREPYAARLTKAVLKKAAPGARVRSSGFRFTLILEAEGDIMEIAQRVTFRRAEAKTLWRQDNPCFETAPNQASIFFATTPETSVRRKSLP